MISASPIRARPLEQVVLTADGPGTLVVRDGRGQAYAKGDAAEPFTITASGALGTHLVMREDRDGRVIDTGFFTISCGTSIACDQEWVQIFTQRLYATLYEGWTSGYAKGILLDKRYYRYFISWIRDHVHTLKAMKYWVGELKSGIDLYAVTQREDGMVWDKVKALYNGAQQTWRDVEFAQGDFIRPLPGHPNRRLCRIPVEADVEYLFVEGLHATWRATGDDVWMASVIDHAIRALRYCLTDHYRWSIVHQLVKRGYTIDTWDFQHNEDARISGGHMRIDPDKTRFGIMHGDNTGTAAACRQLAEMLRRAGRDTEASEWEHIGEEILTRLLDLAWNGEFFRHHVPEHTGLRRETGGVDESSQVTLSNAYAMNRGIGTDRARAIAATYRRIRNEMPEGSPGEFYLCYPPFRKGFKTPLWDYMNGGVSSITAGELSRGAFWCGEEEYGADILRRVATWGEIDNGYFHAVLHGSGEAPPKRSLTTVSLHRVCNASFDGKASGQAIPWTLEGDNDLVFMPTGKQVFHSIPFDVIATTEHGGRTCIGLSRADPYARNVRIDVPADTRTVYLLHTSHGCKGVLGEVHQLKADGSRDIRYLEVGKQIGNWFMPWPVDQYDRGKSGLNRFGLDAVGGDADIRNGCRVAWSGPNRRYANVGVFLTAYETSPGTEAIELHAGSEGGIWFVLGATTSDASCWVPPPRVSYGIPEHWGAAALVYAMVEGLAGVVDTGTAFSEALIAPRWSTVGAASADVDIHYPASDGYVSYRWRATNTYVTCLVAGSGNRHTISILLPSGQDAATVSVDGVPAVGRLRREGASRYIDVDLVGIAARSLMVELRSSV
jgi:hypothetical protein